MASNWNTLPLQAPWQQELDHRGSLNSKAAQKWFKARDKLIVKYAAQERTRKSIAAEFNISVMRVSQIVNKHARKKNMRWYKRLQHLWDRIIYG